MVVVGVTFGDPVGEIGGGGGGGGGSVGFCSSSSLRKECTWLGLSEKETLPAIDLLVDIS